MPLQTSHLPVYKKIWSRMQGFIAEGHNVLSSNHSYHMEKITMDKYAYIIDLTVARFFVSQNSEYTYASELFSPLSYTIALQLHSANSDDVTQL